MQQHTVIDPEAWLASKVHSLANGKGSAAARRSASSSTTSRRSATAWRCTGIYAESFIVRKGSVKLVIGNERVIARTGQILVLPAHVPHAFWNHGPGPLEMIDIHESGTFVTEWLAAESEP